MGDDLNKRIAEAQEKLDARTRPSPASTGKGMGLGFKMASDLVAAVVVGSILGWGLDALFGWSPWALLTGLMLGFAAGVRNVVRTANQANAEAANVTEAAERDRDKAG
jgi:ATP synthase protein I